MVNKKMTEQERNEQRDARAKAAEERAAAQQARGGVGAPKKAAAPASQNAGDELTEVSKNGNQCSIIVLASSFSA